MRKQNVHTAILYGTTDEFKHTTDRHTNPVMVRVRESLPTIMRHALCPSKCDGTKQIQITVRSVECLVAYLDAFQADIPFEPPGLRRKHETAFEPVHGAPFRPMRTSFVDPRFQPVGSVIAMSKVRPLRENEKSSSEAWLSRKRNPIRFPRRGAIFSYHTEKRSDPMRSLRGLRGGETQTKITNTHKTHTHTIVILTLLS